MTATEITVLITAITTGVGSLIGAFVLWRKSRHEANKIRAEESKTRTETFNIEIEVIRETYSRMLTDQVKSVVEPMERRIDRLVKQVNDMQGEIDELKQFRGLFETSILYIRALCHWIDSTQISTETKPKLPPELRAYFELKKGIENEN